MLFSDHLVLLRGGGDLATGVAYRLHQAGFPLIVAELPHPLVVRRTVALAGAVLEGEVHVEDLHAVRVDSPAAAVDRARNGVIPVLVAPDLDALLPALPAPLSVLVDARLAKHNEDTARRHAPFVVGLGPGFSAGEDVHAVVETKRGHRLGRVIWDGPALPNTGTPGIVAGKGRERVLRAPGAGVATWRLAIGDLVQANETIGWVNGHAIQAPFAGVIRGLIAPGAQVRAGLKIGDVDPRGDPAACFLISDKALAVGGGVLAAILVHLNRQE